MSAAGSDAFDLSTAMETWLVQHVCGYQSPGALKKFGFGQSNPTFQLTSASGQYVVRSKPVGTLLPKAHAIDREFFALKKLATSGVPVAEVYAYCDDSSLFGAPFYVMAFVSGRIFYDQTLPSMSPKERHGIFDGINLAIAQLHQVDPAAVGLETYGRGAHFLQRQVELWTRQYRATECTAIPGMESLIDWLPRHIPEEQATRIFHGDLRLDNMIFHPTEPKVIAIIDWELSTLGDPLADFAYNAMIWRIAPSLFRGLHGLPLAEMGIPDEATYVRTYCERTGRPELVAWNFYVAFGLFRVAAILQGVSHRAKHGTASAADAATVGASAAALAELGWSCTAAASLA